MTAVCCTLLWNQIKKKINKSSFEKADSVQQIQWLPVRGRSGSVQRPPHSSDILEQMGVIDLTEVISFNAQSQCSFFFFFATSVI